MPLVIALDYDDTYTEDPEFWEQFIESAGKRGHIVVCVTFRPYSMPVQIKSPIEVFYTGGVPKAQFMRDTGLEPSIWIDDWPELIGKTRC
jgi:hypothetical protein